MGSLFLVVVGLALFETISSVDNAIINAEVLTTMGQKARRWFLTWGMFIAVFLIRGLLPWIIVYAFNPALGFIGSLTATFSNDPSVIASIEQSAPLLLVAGGMFLLLLFFHWLFIEEKHFGLPHTEQFFLKQGVWFYAVASILVLVISWFALKQEPMMAFATLIGSTAFFITHGFKMNAEKAEKELISGTSKRSDMSKLLYLEVIDAIFSIDSVLGSFAFTMSVPLILIGNGVGAVMVRQITMGNIERIKKYVYLKNGAMYSILCLGVIMTLHAFHVDVPEYISPVVTIIVIGYFLYKSWRKVKNEEKATHTV
jgi:hypothetical protein